jgi:hypothetical protein
MQLAPIKAPIRTPIVRSPVAQPTPSPTPPAPELPVGPPQPLASLFVQKLAALAAQGIIDDVTDEFPRLRALTEEQLRAAVASVEAGGKKGALQVRAAFEQAVAELAAMKADESKKKKMMVVGAVAVAAVAAFLFMRRKKS